MELSVTCSSYGKRQFIHERSEFVDNQRHTGAHWPVIVPYFNQYYSNEHSGHVCGSNGHYKCNYYIKTSFGCDKFMGELSVYDIVYCNCFHYECPVFIDGHFAISSLFINFNTRWDFFLLHYTRSLIYISTQPDRRIYLYGQIAIWTSISGTNLHTYI